MSYYLKDPQAVLDYSVEWGAGYLDGQVVSRSVWSVAPDEPDGVRVATQAVSPTRTAVTLEGGVPGKVYRVTNRVTLSDERSDERTLVLRVEER